MSHDQVNLIIWLSFIVLLAFAEAWGKRRKR